jgi:hypothetical protein
LPNYYRAYPNHAKFEGLLSICNAELYKRLSIFIRKAVALLNILDKDGKIKYII